MEITAVLLHAAVTNVHEQVVTSPPNKLGMRRTIIQHCVCDITHIIKKADEVYNVVLHRLLGPLINVKKTVVLLKRVKPIYMYIHLLFTTRVDQTTRQINKQKRKTAS